MGSIRLERIAKSFNEEKILENINLNIPNGTIFALLGPSGCGKTTLLRLIAGFVLPDSGSIYIGNTDITHMPINERKIHTVFQNYALFPHLNVFDNIAYGLKIRKMSQEIIEQKVQTIVQRVQLEKYMYKSIHALSRGQQQRVAFARAVINEPEVLLLDEPMAALDQKLREKLLMEFRDIQNALAITCIYVTHDPSEALAIADHMAVMNADGHIEQTDTPKKIYEFPASMFVAHFMGTANIFSGVLCINAQGAYIQVPDLGVFEVVLPTGVAGVAEGAQVFMGIRPEKIKMCLCAQTDFSNQLTGKVVSIIYQGKSTEYNVFLHNGVIVQVFEKNDGHIFQEIIKCEAQVFLYWNKENAVLLDR